MRATDVLRDDHATMKQMLAELAALGSHDGDARQALLRGAEAAGDGFQHGGCL